MMIMLIFLNSPGEFDPLYYTSTQVSVGYDHAIVEFTCASFERKLYSNSLLYNSVHCLATCFHIGFFWPSVSTSHCLGRSR